jgi:hypothetical protein
MQQPSQIDTIGHDNLERQDARELRRDLEYEKRRLQPTPQNLPTPFSTKCPDFYLKKLISIATSLAKIQSSRQNLLTEKSLIETHQLEGTIPPSLAQNQKLLDGVQNPDLRRQIAESLCLDRISLITERLDKLNAEGLSLFEEVSTSFEALVPTIRANFSLKDCKSFIEHERDITISKFNLTRLDNEKKKEMKRVAFEEKKLKDQEVTVITRREHQDLRRLLSSKPKAKAPATTKQKSKPKNAKARPPLKKETTGHPSRGQVKGKRNKKRS